MSSYNWYTGHAIQIPMRSKIIRFNKQHGISLQDAQEIFDQVYVLDQKSDDPEQYLAIGCVLNQ